MGVRLRAGTATAYSYGNTADGNYIWYDENSGGKTHLVGEKQPNAWGLYDMHGNVWEWCRDRYGPYGTAALPDPAGTTAGLYRVLRGGAFDNGAASLRPAARAGGKPDGDVYVGYYAGFRVARNGD